MFRMLFKGQLVPRKFSLCIGFMLLMVAFNASLRSTLAEARERPNIIIIMADDMGFSDIGCYGGEIETPHLDRLAENGLRFTQFYNTARCCPTRAALLTGLHQHQAGVGHMTGDLGHLAYQGALNDRCVTIAEALRPAGYRTLTTGKWHVGSKEDERPLARGFDRFFGTPTGGGLYFKNTVTHRGNRPFFLDDEEIEPAEDLYVTETFTDYALEFVREAVELERPFFLYLAHIAPHWPLAAKPEDIAKYQGRYDVGWDQVRQARHRRQIELGIIDPDTQLSPRHPRAKAWEEESQAVRKDLAHRMAVYAAQVDCIDQNVGRLVALLQELQLLDDTLILFLSDNGCSAEGGPGGFSRGEEGAVIGTARSYASVGLEWANASDTPFRRFKMDIYEGGVATPLVAHWPAGIERSGELEKTPGHVIDIFPTCLEVAVVDPPNQIQGHDILPPEGRSLVPAFHDEGLESQPLYWEHQGNRGVRIGDWKLVADHNADWELYNLNDDRTELHDLAADHPDKVQELVAAWDAWAERCGVEPWPVR